MNNLKHKQNRGFVSKNEICFYLDSSIEKLLTFLVSKDPIERTIGATILGIKKDNSTIQTLIHSLAIEKKLYPKIAISEALGNIGEMAVKHLIPFLGKIGKNQYLSPPEKIFLKNNYPLPRDIAARTICKVAYPAIPILMQEININDKCQLSEAIDAIGFISYYHNNHVAKNYLLDIFKRNKDPLIIWKLLCSFQAFVDEDIIDILKNIINNSKVATHILQARKSLDQIQRREKVL